MRDVGGNAFKDHFSGHAAGYASARPRYPDALFEHLAGLCRGHARAWDCATGNGQAARSLVKHFPAVVATDASEAQIAAAVAEAGVTYRVAPAEASGLDTDSIDLVTVAQALHWFDIEAFFAEARRVLRPGGVLAAWCYGTCRAEPACDRLVQDYYRSLDPWWPPERAIVESGYRDIRLPFETLADPGFTMQVSWTAPQMLAYLASWSATERCRRDSGRDPLAALAPALGETWGERARKVTWPLYLKAGRAA